MKKIILILFFLISCKESILKKNYNVVLITLDTTRADYLSVYNSNGVFSSLFDKILKNGVLFKNAFTPIPLTLPAHGSILTGKYPHRINLLVNGRGFLKSDFYLPKFFKERKYTTSAIVSSAILDKTYNLDYAFDYYDDDFQNKKFRNELTSEELYEKFLKYSDKILKPPFFWWLHFFDPHYPYKPPKEYENKYNNPYKGEIAYALDYVEKILNLLENKNLIDDTLVIVVGDHGEGLNDHNEKGHGYLLYESTLKIPFLMRFPSKIKINKNIIEEPVSLIDIAPTLVEIISNENYQFDGSSILPLIFNKNFPKRELFALTVYPETSMGLAPLYSLRFGRYKYIVGSYAELFDWIEDPLERNNILNEKKEIKKYNNKIKFFLSVKNKIFDKREPPKELKSLGYLSGKPPEIKEEIFSNLPDPRDKIYLIEKFIKIVEDCKNISYKEIKERAEELIKILPNSYELYIFLTEVSFERGFWEETKLYLKKALKLYKESYILLIKAKIEYNEKEFENSLKTIDYILSLNPKNIEAVILKIKILDRINKKSEAIDILQEYLINYPNEKSLILLFIQKFLNDYPEDRLNQFLKTLKSKYLNLILGFYYYNKNNFSYAIEYLNKSEEVEAINLHSLILLKNNLPKEALYNLKKAYDLKIQNFQTFSISALCFEKLGKNEEAIATYKAALALNENDPETLFNFAQFLYKLGNKKEAKLHYTKFLKLADKDKFKKDIEIAKNNLKNLN